MPLSLIRSDIKNITVILGSSRSGSSFLFKQLSRLENMISPLGEETPFYRLEDVGWIKSPEDSDEILADSLSEKKLDAIFKNLMDDTALDASSSVTTKPLSEELFLKQTLKRLRFQWPELSMDHLQKQLPALAHLSDEDRKHKIWELIEKSGGMASIYDGAERSTAASTALPARFLEEPPYVLPRLRALADKKDWASGSLLLKTSTNAYRIPVLRKLFPKAKIKWIVLTRHPMGSINGLIEGWKSPWFHSHNMQGVCELQIPDYSSNWWKFDAPPGWSTMQGKHLHEICAYQWTSAYKTILKNLTPQDSVLRVVYEELCNTNTYERAFVSIFNYLGVDKTLGFQALDLKQKVMASQIQNDPDEAYERWRKSKTEFAHLLDFPFLKTTAQDLGYDLRKDYR